MELAGESGRDPLVAAVDLLAAGLAALLAAPVDGLTYPELLAQLNRLNTVSWALPAVEHRLTGRLAAEADPKALGDTSLVNVLATTLRITGREARRRLEEAAQLGPRRALTGEALAPQLATTAAAQARGAIGPDHVRIIRTALRQLRLGRPDHPRPGRAHPGPHRRRPGPRPAAPGRRPARGDARPGRRRVPRRRTGPPPRPAHRAPTRRRHE
jgi:hypothetical protein